jgi:hypothetical protein
LYPFPANRYIHELYQGNAGPRGSKKRQAPKKHIITNNENIIRESPEMAGPYLKSGESIILTTDRVLIDDVEYDLILTSHRLALVDSGHFNEQPQVVPFDTIISVKGGTTPAREPCITIAVVDPADIDNEKTLKLIFTQQPYQDRAAECDLWVKKLIEHIVSVRHEPAPAGKQPVDVKAEGTHATIRRYVAPEKIRPHSDVPLIRKPSEELLSALQKTAQEKYDHAPVEPGQSEQPDIEVTSEPEREGELPSPDLLPEEESIDITPIAKTSPHDEGIHFKRESHSEETAGQPAPEVPLTEKIPEETRESEEQSSPLIAEESLSIKVPDLRDQEQRRPEPMDDIEKFAGVYADKIPGPAVSYGALSELDIPGDVQAEESKTPDDESSEGTGLPDTVVFPVLSGSVNQDETPKTPERNAPPVPIEPPSPGKTAGKKPVGMIVAIILVLIVVFGATAMIVLSSPAGVVSGANNTVVVPIVTSPPVTTLVPQEVMPSQGVWVKVTYNGTYLGEYGNPGGLILVRGTGEQFYAIKNSSDLVQASFQKMDYSGDTLTVDIYNNGSLITDISKSAPEATIALLVDPKTGKPPYVPVRQEGVP